MAMYPHARMAMDSKQHKQMGYSSTFSYDTEDSPWDAHWTMMQW